MWLSSTILCLEPSHPFSKYWASFASSCTAKYSEERKKSRHPVGFEPTTSRVMLCRYVLYRCATTTAQRNSLILEQLNFCLDKSIVTTVCQRSWFFANILKFVKHFTFQISPNSFDVRRKFSTFLAGGDEPSIKAKAINSGTGRLEVMLFKPFIFCHVNEPNSISDPAIMGSAVPEWNMNLRSHWSS